MPPGTLPLQAFAPVLRNGVTTEFHHVEALKAAGGTPLTTKYWLPDAAFGGGGAASFLTLEIIETVEISLYLIGVSAYARLGEEVGARLCAEAMGTEAVHRALVRFAQGQLGKDVGVPNDVGFENFDWPTVEKVKERHWKDWASATARPVTSPAGSTSTRGTRSRGVSARRSATLFQAELPSSAGVGAPVPTPVSLTDPACHEPFFPPVAAFLNSGIQASTIPDAWSNDMTPCRVPKMHAPVFGLSTTPVKDIKSELRLQLERDMLALVYRSPR